MDIRMADSNNLGGVSMTKEISALITAMARRLKLLTPHRPIWLCLQLPGVKSWRVDSQTRSLAQPRLWRDTMNSSVQPIENFRSRVGTLHTATTPGSNAWIYLAAWTPL